MKSVEELLRPQYKVIARWPGMELDLNYIGQVITLTIQDNKQWCIRLHRATLYDAYFNQYPHLFEPLPWWKDRRPEEMPEYIKSNDNKAIRPMNELTPVGFRICCIEKWVPATKEEYEANQQTTNQLKDGQ
jgi:hypothetical protein